MSECPIEYSSEVAVACASQKDKAEDELRRFTTAVRTSLDGIITGDLYGNITDVNDAVLRMYGCTDKGDLIGKHVLDFVVERDRERALLDSMDSLRTGQGRTTEYRALTRNGAEVPIEITTGFIRDEQGEPIGFVDIIHNITERKRAEAAMVEMMQKTVLMNEKLRVVGGLTRHDVRNKLSIITGNIYLNKKRFADHPDILKSYEEMESACQQIVRIFDFAKDYEMLGAEELNYIDVEDAVQKAVSLFSDLDGTKVTNECHGLNVLADSLLRQLFYNLIDNSLKYGRKTTKVNVHFEKTERDELKLFYGDDGVGIPYDEKPKLFKEGHTTGRGSGYGLFLIKKIIEVYGWTIQETGKPGKGVQFTIKIPKVNQRGKENYQII
ncbi:MAG TPA: PAS domain S-box protein [candidate division Zixibacteria bacterium]|nr:PAS domain S-box protein [candidate division Zixibacteria bacterium]